MYNTKIPYRFHENLDTMHLNDGIVINDELNHIQKYFLMPLLVRQSLRGNKIHVTILETILQDGS